jgi:hypothetical protein
LLLRISPPICLLPSHSFHLSLLVFFFPSYVSMIPHQSAFGAAIAFVLSCAPFENVFSFLSFSRCKICPLILRNLLNHPS